MIRYVYKKMFSDLALGESSPPQLQVYDNHAVFCGKTIYFAADIVEGFAEALQTRQKVVIAIGFRFYTSGSVPLLEVRYQDTRKGTRTYIFPVPRGKEDEAEKIAQQLNQATASWLKPWT